MERLAALLALNGTLVLIISFVAGLLLHRAVRLQKEPGPWHLAHAGGSGRGILLLALAPVLRWTALPFLQISMIVWLMLFFVWTSIATMMLAAATGHRGLGWHGSPMNKLVYALYVAGAIVVFPAAFWLAAGLYRGLIRS